MVVLVGAVCSVSAIIIVQFFQDDGPRRAIQSARAIALQIRSERSQAKRAGTSAQRNPSSVAPNSPQLTEGTIGKDPWGQSFQFLVRKGQGRNGRIVERIYIWSYGSDGSSNSNSASFDLSTEKAKIRFGGDDVGFVEEYTIE